MYFNGEQFHRVKTTRLVTVEFFLNVSKRFLISQIQIYKKNRTDYIHVLREIFTLNSESSHELTIKKPVYLTKLSIFISGFIHA